MLVQEGSVYDRREDSDTSGEAEGDVAPLLPHHLGAVGVTETVNAGADIVPVVRYFQAMLSLHWSRCYHSDATPALLCHKEPAQDTKIPLLGAFLAFRWFFMA